MSKTVNINIRHNYERADLKFKSHPTDYMLRSVRRLVSEARHNLAPGRISRRFNSFFRRMNRIPLLCGARLCRSRCLTSRVSEPAQCTFREAERYASSIFQRRKHYANERADNGGSPFARTRRARCRTQVLHSSSSHLLTCQVVTVLSQIGLRIHIISEGRLTVTWPTETNLDGSELQEPLSVALEICRDQGMKFRRLSGSESLFRWKLQEVLALVYAQCGW